MIENIYVGKYDFFMMIHRDFDNPFDDPPKRIALDELGTVGLVVFSEIRRFTGKLMLHVSQGGLRHGLQRLQNRKLKRMYKDAMRHFGLNNFSGVLLLHYAEGTLRAIEMEG